MEMNGSVNSQIEQIFQESTVSCADVCAGDRRTCLLKCRFDRAPSTSGSAGWNSMGDRRYLIASLTKSVVATLFVQHASEGHFYLNEPVRSFLNGFHRGTHRTITLRHLLTHSSGLPDMLPDNNELRARHATLEEFVLGTAAQEPAFSPGTGTSYCSMGFALLSHILQQRCGLPCSEIMNQRLFAPLGMCSSWLGLPVTRAEDLMPTVVPCELPDWQTAASDWNWNSVYWRTLGAPWGGMISSAADLGVFLQCLLNEGVHRATGEPTIDPRVARACTRNQTARMSFLPKIDRRFRPWGLGWRLNWPDHSGCFSDFLPATAFGHWGATGTLMWADRKSGHWCVILTNQPFEQSQVAIQRVSNLVAARGFSPAASAAQ